MWPNKAKEYQFEALHEIYFYDAWRSQPELNKTDSLLHLPQGQGCSRLAAIGGPTCLPTVHQALNDMGVLAEVSLTEEESTAHSCSRQPSQIPSPSSTDHEAQ